MSAVHVSPPSVVLRIVPYLVITIPVSLSRKTISSTRSTAPPKRYGRLSPVSVHDMPPSVLLMNVPCGVFEEAQISEESAVNTLTNCEFPDMLRAVLDHVFPLSLVIRIEPNAPMLPNLGFAK